MRKTVLCPVPKDRISVANALEFVIENAEFDPAVDIFVEVFTDADGVEHVIPEGRLEAVQSDGRGLAAQKVKASFKSFCDAFNVIPRDPYAPWVLNYDGTSTRHDALYEISIDDLREFAAGYRLDVGPFRLTSVRDTDEDAATAQATTGPISTTERNADHELARLFDPVKKGALAKMFPPPERWDDWCERAKRNGLESARVGRAVFNPYLAGIFFANQGVSGWDLARVYRVLASNLPARSSHARHMLTGTFTD